MIESMLNLIVRRSKSHKNADEVNNHS